MAEHVVLDAKELEVLEDDLLKLGVFLCWVCVIKAHDELALVAAGKVVVEHGSLGVANVQIAACLWWEPRHDIALCGAVKSKELACVVRGGKGHTGRGGGKRGEEECMIDMLCCVFVSVCVCESECMCVFVCECV